MRWLTYLAGAVLLGAAVWLSVTGIYALTQASATARLGVVTAAISIATFVYNNNRQQKREILSRQFNDKRAAYQKFFDFLFDISDAQKSGTPLTEETLGHRMQGLTKDMMIWESADTIN